MLWTLVLERRVRAMMTRHGPQKVHVAQSRTEFVLSLRERKHGAASGGRASQARDDGIPREKLLEHGLHPVIVRDSCTPIRDGIRKRGFVCVFFTVFVEFVTSFPIVFVFLIVIVISLLIIIVFAFPFPFVFLFIFSILIAFLSVFAAAAVREGILDAIVNVGTSRNQVVRNQRCLFFVRGVVRALRCRHLPHLAGRSPRHACHPHCVSCVFSGTPAEQHSRARNLSTPTLEDNDAHSFATHDTHDTDTENDFPVDNNILPWRVSP